MMRVTLNISGSTSLEPLLNIWKRTKKKKERKKRKAIKQTVEDKINSNTC